MVMLQLSNNKNDASTGKAKLIRPKRNMDFPITTSGQKSQQMLKSWAIGEDDSGA